MFYSNWETPFFSLRYIFLLKYGFFFSHWDTVFSHCETVFFISREYFFSSRDGIFSKSETLSFLNERLHFVSLRDSLFSLCATIFFIILKYNFLWNLVFNHFFSFFKKVSYLCLYIILKYGLFCPNFYTVPSALLTAVRMEKLDVWSASSGFFSTQRELKIQILSSYCTFI